MPFTTSTSNRAALAVGGYSLCPSQDCWVTVGTDNTVTGGIPSSGTTQPAINNTIFCPAGQNTPLNVTGATPHIAVVRDTADGTLRISGPMQEQ